MKVTDAHVHFFDLSGHRDWYPQLPEFARAVGTPELASDFGVADHRQAAGGHHQVGRMVHVSATTTPRAYLAETPWVNDIADSQGLELRIIGSVEPSLTPSELVRDLEAQAACSRFVGVRVLSGLEPDTAAASTILSWLSEHQLVFDLVSSPAPMSDWLRTLEHHPGLSVVLEHTGWPSGTDDRARAQWRTALTDFATGTEGLCKLSGLGMVTQDLALQTLQPWLTEAIDILGWDRVAFGSNLPIELMAGSPTTLFETLDAVVGAADSQQQQGFWADNADRVYWARSAEAR